MTEHTAKQWLQTEVLPHPEQYSLGHYAGPTQPSDLVAFLAQAKNDIKGAINLDKGSLQDPQYKFMSAKQVYKPGETNALFTRKVAEFFCLLFRKIRDDAKHQLTQYDLWHGHFVDAGSHGLVIIFHAKEQPSDIVTDGMDNSKSPFSSADTCFYGRNVLWMAESNTFYVLDAGDTSYIYKVRCGQSFGLRSQCYIVVHTNPHRVGNRFGHAKGICLLQHQYLLD